MLHLELQYIVHAFRKQCALVIASHMLPSRMQRDGHYGSNVFQQRIISEPFAEKDTDKMRQLSLPVVFDVMQDILNARALGKKEKRCCKRQRYAAVKHLFHGVVAHPFKSGERKIDPAMHAQMPFSLGKRHVAASADIRKKEPVKIRRVFLNG
jgi:hypothetical protein